MEFVNDYSSLIFKFNNCEYLYVGYIKNKDSDLNIPIFTDNLNYFDYSSHKNIDSSKYYLFQNYYYQKIDEENNSLLDIAMIHCEITSRIKPLITRPVVLADKEITDTLYVYQDKLIGTYSQIIEYLNDKAIDCNLELDNDIYHSGMLF